MKGILKYFFVFSLMGLLLVQSTLGSNALNFAQVNNTDEYVPSVDKFTVTIDSNGKYIDSGYKVSETDGEVLIRRGDQPNSWESAWAGDTIYEGDVLFTTKDTECTIAISGQITLHMQAQTEIFFNFSEQKKQLKVIYGKVLTDLEEGNNQPVLSFELSQAVVDVDDAILICESKESTSRVLVIAGKAEVKEQNSNTTILNSNEEILIKASGSDVVKQFSSDSELLEWTSEIRNKVTADILSRKSKLTDEQIQETTITDKVESGNYDMISILKLFAALIIVVVIIYVILGKRKKE